MFPSLLLLLPVLLLAGWGVVYLARRPIVDSLRYDALSRSPINSLFVASLGSLPTIRAFRQTPWMRAHFEDSLVEQNGRAYFSYFCFSRWLGLQIDLFAIFQIAGCLLASFLAPPSPASHSSMTVALTSVLQLLNFF